MQNANAVGKRALDGRKTVVSFSICSQSTRNPTMALWGSGVRIPSAPPNSARWRFKPFIPGVSYGQNDVEASEQILGILPVLGNCREPGRHREHPCCCCSQFAVNPGNDEHDPDVNNGLG